VSVLNACPWCGEDINDIFHFVGDDDSWGIVCFSCGAEGPDADDLDAAYALWNRPLNASAIEARRAETAKQGSVEDESAVAKPDAHTSYPNP
jgi:hypothetical protein